MAEVRRIFTCKCGYKLRYGATRCGDCYAPTPFYNRIYFWRAIIVLLPLAAGTMVLVAVA